MLCEFIHYKCMIQCYLLLKNILRKWVCDILHKYRSDRIQWLQTIIVSRSEESLPVVGLPKHLTCLPEVPDRSTLCSVGIYGICWFEVLFWKGHNGFNTLTVNSWFVCFMAREPLIKKKQRSANGKIQKFINVNKITEYTGNEVFDWVVGL